MNNVDYVEYVDRGHVRAPTTTLLLDPASPLVHLDRYSRFCR